MKKSTYTFLAFVLFLLTSCGKFSDGTSVWSDSLWIVPLLPALGSIFFGYKAFKISKTASLEQPGGTPIYKIGQFWFSVALAVATFLIILMVNSDK